ncbi:MAG TPA: class I SAM-dependent methyltransferase [Gemmatimonadales bacterium]|nr:class I SAM-dependent methyltransferase [Gemmatimonadales bacterium]
MTAGLKDVQTFWDANPCGAGTVAAEPGTLEFFLQYERYRYADEPYIQELLDLDGVRGKRVVEIGCGLGTDGVQFTRAGALYAGVDLTPVGARLTYRNHALRGLPARTVTASVEDLGIASSSIDLVYSHGVLHHTPGIDRAVDEIWRILRPDGRLHLMLYHKHSFNYLVSIQVLRRLGALMLVLPGGMRLAHRLTGEPVANLDVHRRRLREQRLHYLFGPEWLSRNTDGPDSPLARVYSRRTARALLRRFTDFRFVVTCLNRRHLPLVGQHLPRSAERWLAARAGWHLHVFARKRSSV